MRLVRIYTRKPQPGERERPRNGALLIPYLARRARSAAAVPIVHNAIHSAAIGKLKCLRTIEPPFVTR